MRTHAALAVVVAFAGVAVAQDKEENARDGTVEVNEQKFVGKIWIKGNRVYLKRGSTILEWELDPSKVKITYATAEEKGTGGKKTAEPEQDRAIDFDGRFVLERPGPEWKIVRTISPEIRARMVLADKDAFVQVAVRPVASSGGYADLNKDSVKKLGPDVDADLKRDLERYTGLVIELAELFGTPVAECRYDGNYPTEATTYQFVEQRFVRDNLLYVITGAAEKKNIFKDVEPKLREAFTFFSFIAAQGGDDDGYNDLVKGFGIDRPTARWSMDVRPFDEKEPVVVYNEDKSAEIHVYCQEASGPASVFITNFLKGQETQSGFKKIEQKSTLRLGAPVETYRCEFYPKGESKKRDYQGLAAVVGGTLIHVEGISPINDEAAKIIQGEVAKTLERFRFIDPEGARNRLNDRAKASKEFAAGADAIKAKKFPEAVTAFTNAIKEFPDFARAYYLRAVAQVELKQWKAYREDLEKVDELDPRPENQARETVLLFTEIRGRLSENPPQFPEAARAWKEIVRADPKNEKLHAEHLRFFDNWWTTIKKGPVKTWVDGLEDMEKFRSPEKVLSDRFSNFYVEAGENILRDNKRNYSRASECARRATAFDNDNPRIKQLKTQIDQAEKDVNKPTNPPPKKK